MNTSCCFIVSFRRLSSFRPTSMFPLYLSVHIFHYARSKLMARFIPVLNWPEKSIISSSRYISVAIFYLVWALGRIRNIFINWIPSSNFDYSATVKPRPSPEYNKTKFSVLPPTQLFFTVIAVLVLQQILLMLT